MNRAEILKGKYPTAFNLGAANVQYKKAGSDLWNYDANCPLAEQSDEKRLALVASFEKSWSDLLEKAKEHDLAFPTASAVAELLEFDGD